MSRGRRRQPQLLPQRPAFISGAEKSPALQLGNEVLDDLLDAGGKDGGNDIEPIRRALEALPND